MADVPAGFYFTNRRFRRWKYRWLDRPKSRLTARRARTVPAVHAWADAIAHCRIGMSPEDRPMLARVEGIRAALLASPQAIRVGNQEQAVAAICERQSVKPERGLFLYCLARALRPAGVLELGTCLGVSAAYLAAGLEANGSGSLVSIDVEGEKVDVAAAHLTRARLDARVRLVRARFHEVLPSLLAETLPFQLVYVDGHHAEAPTVGYFSQIADGAKGATVVFDDITWSSGMVRAWKTIAADPRVEFAGEAFGFGLVRVRS